MCTLKSLLNQTDITFGNITVTDIENLELLVPKISIDWIDNL